jgi:hypothetical protein
MGSNPELEAAAVELMAIRRTKNSITKTEKEIKEQFDRYVDPLMEEFEDAKKFLFQGFEVEVRSRTTLDATAMKTALLVLGVSADVVEEAVRRSQKHSEYAQPKKVKDA